MATAAKLTGSFLGPAPSSAAVLSGGTLTSPGAPQTTTAKLSGSTLTSPGVPSGAKALMSGGVLTSAGAGTGTVALMSGGILTSAVLPGRYHYRTASSKFVRHIRYRYDLQTDSWIPFPFGDLTALPPIPAKHAPAGFGISPFGTSPFGS